MSLQDQMDALMKEQESLIIRRDKMKAAVWNHGAILSRNNGKIAGLLERIYLDDDETARKELNEHNAYITELKQFKMFSEELLRRTERRMADTQGQIDKLRPQITHETNQSKHWNNEYKAASTRLSRCTFATFDRVKDRVLECAQHRFVDKKAEALELISAKEKEFFPES
jgi:hypothetical protein